MVSVNFIKKLFDAPTELKSIEKLNDLLSDVGAISVELEDIEALILHFKDFDKYWVYNHNLTIHDTDHDYLNQVEKVNDICVSTTDIAKSFFKHNEIDTLNIKYEQSFPIYDLNNNISGRLVIFYNKEHFKHDAYTKIFRLLSKRISKYIINQLDAINHFYELERSKSHLDKVIKMAPCLIYQLEKDANGNYSYPFCSPGFEELFPLEELVKVRNNDPSAFSFIHKDDRERYINDLKNAVHSNKDYRGTIRYVYSNNKVVWFLLQSTVNRFEDGSASWIGTLLNITDIKEYEISLEQISFDISHVLRKPISTLMGLTALINDEPNDLTLLREYNNLIHTVSNELNAYTKKLNSTYEQKRSSLKLNLKNSA